MKEIKLFENVLPQEAEMVRTRVFIEEQGFKEEFDHIDSKAIHIVIFCDGVPCATGRLFKSDKDDITYKIGRVAVLKSYRGRNLGAKVISLLEEKCREIGGERIVLSAQ